MLESTTLLALGLVVASAGAHATWNLLLKRARRQEVFVWWLAAFSVVGTLPVAVIVALRTTFEPVGIWFIVISALLHIGYFLFLGRSLARGDLSLVYPIARGFGPGLVPVLAVLVLGETVPVLGWVGIACIVAGIYVMAWWDHLRQFGMRPMGLPGLNGVRYAMLTGLCIALYTIVDKRGVSYVSPFLYLYLMTCGVALGMLPYIIRNYGFTGVVEEWKSGGWRIPVASGLVYLAYGLVLTAMQIAEASYVAPAREIGLLFGVAMGAIVLKERVTRGRLAGASVLVSGLVLITAAE